LSILKVYNINSFHGSGPDGPNKDSKVGVQITEIMIVWRKLLYLLSAILLSAFATAEAKEISNTPSLLDVPDKGLYYGFVLNNSSNFVEVSIWAVKEKKKVYRNIVLPPAKSINEGNGQTFKYWDKRVDAFRPPNVFALWLHLGTYKVSVRQRKDMIDQGDAGTWKTFVVVLDKEYIESSPGPFTFEIEDD
jgi:hypothetical protein